MQAITKETSSSQYLADRYREVRTFTEQLCEPLEIEDYIPQPVIDVSPARWNIAHTTWFFEEMILKRFVSGYEAFDPDFGFLFNSYYNTLGSRTPRDNRGALSRPTVKRVFEYRRYVDEQMHVLLTRGDAGSNQDLVDLITLGINHEQQHQELLLSDLKYTFSVNPLFPAYREGYFPEETIGAGDGFVEIESGLYDIGHGGEGFCFDNEIAQHKVYLDRFSVSSSLVTNREYLDFINDGGYRDHTLWHAEGWDWVNENSIGAPLYWVERNEEWYQFTLGGLRPLALGSPVCHVSFYEAAAFAEWRSTRLLTEFEWEAASSLLEWGERWEWTNSAYLPYPGFIKAKGAIGEYNGKFMVNQMILRGASVVTPKGHSRPTYRNFFHPHLRWQFTGIRLAK